MQMIFSLFTETAREGRKTRSSPDSAAEAEKAMECA
jgi:hypothetical protein